MSKRAATYDLGKPYELSWQHLVQLEGGEGSTLNFRVLEKYAQVPRGDKAEFDSAIVVLKDQFAGGGRAMSEARKSVEAAAKSDTDFSQHYRNNRTCVLSHCTGSGLQEIVCAAVFAVVQRERSTDQAVIVLYIATPSEYRRLSLAELLVSRLKRLVQQLPDKAAHKAMFTAVMDSPVARAFWVGQHFEETSESKPVDSMENCQGHYQEFVGLCRKLMPGGTKLWACGPLSVHMEAVCSKVLDKWRNHQAFKQVLPIPKAADSPVHSGMSDTTTSVSTQDTDRQMPIAGKGNGQAITGAKAAVTNGVSVSKPAAPASKEGVLARSGAAAGAAVKEIVSMKQPTVAAQQQVHVQAKEQQGITMKAAAAGSSRPAATPAAKPAGVHGVHVAQHAGASSSGAAVIPVAMPPAQRALPNQAAPRPPLQPQQQQQRSSASVSSTSAAGAVTNLLPAKRQHETVLQMPSQKQRTVLPPATAFIPGSAQGTQPAAPARPVQPIAPLAQAATRPSADGTHMPEPKAAVTTGTTQQGIGQNHAHSYTNHGLPKQEEITQVGPSGAAIDNKLEQPRRPLGKSGFKLSFARDNKPQEAKQPEPAPILPPPLPSQPAVPAAAATTTPNVPVSAVPVAASLTGASALHGMQASPASTAVVGEVPQEDLKAAMEGTRSYFQRLLDTSLQTKLQTPEKAFKYVQLTEKLRQHNLDLLDMLEELCRLKLSDAVVDNIVDGQHKAHHDSQSSSAMDIDHHTGQQQTRGTWDPASQVSQQGQHLQALPQPQSQSQSFPIMDLQPASSLQPVQAASWQQHTQTQQNTQAQQQQHPWAIHPQQHAYTGELHQPHAQVPAVPTTANYTYSTLGPGAAQPGVPCQQSQPTWMQQQQHSAAGQIPVLATSQQHVVSPATATAPHMPLSEQQQQQQPVGSLSQQQPLGDVPSAWQAQPHVLQQHMPRPVQGTPNSSTSMEWHAAEPPLSTAYQSHTHLELRPPDNMLMPTADNSSPGFQAPAKQQLEQTAMQPPPPITSLSAGLQAAQPPITSLSAGLQAAQPPITSLSAGLQAAQPPGPPITSLSAGLQTAQPPGPPITSLSAGLQAAQPSGPPITSLSAGLQAAQPPGPPITSLSAVSTLQPPLSMPIQSLGQPAPIPSLPTRQPVSIPVQDLNSMPQPPSQPLPLPTQDLNSTSHPPLPLIQPLGAALPPRPPQPRPTAPRAAGHSVLASTSTQGTGGSLPQPPSLPPSAATAPNVGASLTAPSAARADSIVDTVMKAQADADAGLGSQTRAGSSGMPDLVTGGGAEGPARPSSTQPVSGQDGSVEAGELPQDVSMDSASSDSDDSKAKKKSRHKEKSRHKSKHRSSRSRDRRHGRRKSRSASRDSRDSKDHRGCRQDKRGTESSPRRRGKQSELDPAHARRDRSPQRTRRDASPDRKQRDRTPERTRHKHSPERSQREDSSRRDISRGTHGAVKAEPADWDLGPVVLGQGTVQPGVRVIPEDRKFKSTTGFEVVVPKVDKSNPIPVPFNVRWKNKSLNSVVGEVFRNNTPKDKLLRHMSLYLRDKGATRTKLVSHLIEGAYLELYKELDNIDEGPPWGKVRRLLETCTAFRIGEKAGEEYVTFDLEQVRRGAMKRYSSR